MEDLAILRRLKARYQLQVCNPQPAHSTIQTTRAFLGRLFLVNHLLHVFSGAFAYFTAQAEGANRPRASAVNAIRHGKRVVTTTYCYIQVKNMCQLGCILPATVDCITHHITHAKVCQYVYDCHALFKQSPNNHHTSPRTSPLTTVPLCIHKGGVRASLCLQMRVSWSKQAPWSSRETLKAVVRCSMQ